MKIHKQLAALALTLLLCAVPASTAFAAHPAPDLSREDGSIYAAMNYDGQPVGGGSLTLYRVGDVQESDGDYSFVLTEEFAGGSALLPDNEVKRYGEGEGEISYSDLAADLAAHASANGLSGTTVTIGNDGKIEFTGLKMGLYLIVQNTPADGFEAISPFLVSLPMYMEVYNEESGETEESYIYQVNVESKMSELTKKPEPTTPEGGSDPAPGTHTDTPVDTPEDTTTVTTDTNVDTTVIPTVPAVPDPGQLPQTGQLNWPVPVLAALGLCLILAGWVLRSGGQRKHYGA